MEAGCGGGTEMQIFLLNSLPQKNWSSAASTFRGTMPSDCQTPGCEKLPCCCWQRDNGRYGVRPCSHPSRCSIQFYASFTDKRKLFFQDALEWQKKLAKIVVVVVMVVGCVCVHACTCANFTLNWQKCGALKRTLQKYGSTSCRRMVCNRYFYCLML